MPKKRNRHSKSKKKKSHKIQYIDDFTDDDSSSSTNSMETPQSIDDIKNEALINAILPEEEKNKYQKDRRFMFSIYATGVFFLLNIPFLDNLIKSAFPMTESWLVLLAIKTLTFFVILYFIKILIQ